MRCYHCGTPFQPGQPTCLRCGAPLTAAAPPAPAASGLVATIPPAVSRRRWPWIVGIGAGIVVIVLVVAAIVVLPRLLGGEDPPYRRGIVPAMAQQPTVAWTGKDGQVSVTDWPGNDARYLVVLADKGQSFARVTVWDVARTAPLWAADVPKSPGCSVVMVGRVSCLVGSEMRDFDVKTGAVLGVVRLSGTPQEAQPLPGGDIVTASWERSAVGASTLAEMRITLTRVARDGTARWTSRATMQTTTQQASFGWTGDSTVAFVSLGVESLFNGRANLAVVVRDVETGAPIGDVPDGADLRIRADHRYDVGTLAGTDVYDARGTKVASIGAQRLGWDVPDDQSVPVMWSSADGATTLYTTSGSRVANLPKESMIAVCGGAVVTATQAKERSFHAADGAMQGRVTLPVDTLPDAVFCDRTRVIEASAKGGTMSVVAYTRGDTAWKIQVPVADSKLPWVQPTAAGLIVHSGSDNAVLLR